MKPLVLLAALALAACADPHAPLSPDFGNAVASNIAAQVVNPAPTAAGLVPANGQRMESAIERYVTNKVYRPQLPLENGSIYNQSQQQQQ